MKHNRTKKSCYCPDCKKKMRGGGCGCSGSGSASASTNSVFSGGYKPKGKKGRRFSGGLRRFGGGSAHLSELSKSAYYPLNDRMNDASDPSQQTASRFQNFSDYTQERQMPFSGGKRTRKSRKSKSRKTSRKGKKRNTRTKKMKGGMPYSNFVSSNMNSNNLGHMSSMLLGANPTNEPSHLQGIGPYAPQTSAHGYDNHNTYLT